MTDATDTPLVDNLLSAAIQRGRCTIMGGLSGAGKSTLLFQWLQEMYAATDAAQGTAHTDGPPSSPEFFGLPMVTGLKVAYVAGEKGMKDIYDVSTKVDLDVTRITALWTVGNLGYEESLTWDLLRSVLSKLLEDYPDLDVILVESIFAWNRVGTINDYTTTAGLLTKLSQWLEAHPRVALVATHHINKPRTDFTYRIASALLNGSAAIAGGVSNNMILQSDQELKKPYFAWTLGMRSLPSKTIYLQRPETQKRFTLCPLVVQPLNRKEQAAAAVVEAIKSAPPGTYTHKALKELVVDLIQCSVPTFNRGLEMLREEGLIETNHEGRYLFTNAEVML